MTNIAQRQNEPKNIKRLAAQRQIYSDIKFWMVVIFLVGVALPVVVSILTFFLNSDYFSQLLGFDKIDIGFVSATIGVLAGIYVDKHSNHLKSRKEAAAKIQEEFDTEVFGFEWDETNIGDRGQLTKRKLKHAKPPPMSVAA